MAMNNFIFIIILILTVILINQNTLDNFLLKMTKYNIILINHEKYQMIILNDVNSIENKIYKIYKN